MLTHEKVVGVRIGSANLEQLHQIVELPVNITTDGDWAFLDGRVSSKEMIRPISNLVNSLLAGRSTRLVELLAPVQFD